MTATIPALQSFTVRLEAAATTCQLTGFPLPAIAETLTVEAADRRAAYRRVPAVMKSRLMGQTLHIYIDGVQEFSNCS